MDSKTIGQLIYAKIFNKIKQTQFPCNIELGNVTIDIIKADPKHGVIFHTTKNHGIPLAHLDKNTKYMDTIAVFVNSLS